MNRKLTEEPAGQRVDHEETTQKKRITNRNEKKYYSVGSKTSPKKNGKISAKTRNKTKR